MFKLIACLFIPCIFINIVLSEFSIEKKERFLNGFIEYLNNIPSHPYVYDEGILIKAEKVDPNNDIIHIEAILRTSNEDFQYNKRTVKCTGEIIDLLEGSISIENQPECQEVEDVSNVPISTSTNDPNLIETTEHLLKQLDNEEQTEEVTSGEQFIAIRKGNNMPCTGCADHVNPDAAGVRDLADLAIKHLDKHNPAVKHILESIIDVERQVQIVSGIKYTLTLKINFDKCPSEDAESCNENKACKISILEKTWIKYTDGTKYRAITANNCTEQWLFDDEGEIITDSNGKHKLKVKLKNKVSDGNQKPTTSESIDVLYTQGDDEFVNEQYNSNLEAQLPHVNFKVLSEDEVKNIQEQIVPHEVKSSKKIVTKNSNSVECETSKLSSVKQLKEIVKENILNTANPPKSIDQTPYLNEEKKQAIDDLFNLFNSAGFSFINPDDIPRIKRSYDNDLQMLSVVEKLYKLKQNIKNANLIYSLAQKMVDYLNEMDIEIKNRILQEVITAEEESENFQHFYYIQARIVIPCNEVNCETTGVNSKICNGIIENAEDGSTQILTSFCYDDQKTKTNFVKIFKVPLDDPLLKRLMDKAIKQIEDGSSSQNAIIVKQILDATTRKEAGTFTKILVEIVFTNCNKSLSLKRRDSCTIIENMGSKICEIIIIERHWIKATKITNTCNKRPNIETFSNTKSSYQRDENVKDPIIRSMLRQALQYLQMNSNRNNKQRIIDITHITTQLFAGLLTNFNFTVGYTDCKEDNSIYVELCNLIQNEPIRKCQVVVWDRPWLEDGRQLNVTCDDMDGDILRARKKRSSVFVVGGSSEKNPNDPKYMLLAEESMALFLSNTGNNNKYQVSRIDQVTVKVVSGTLTTIEFSVSSTDAEKNGAVMQCYTEIWEKTWLNFKEITNITCNIKDASREKRQIPGGSTEKNPDDPRFLTLAKESLNKYVQIVGSSQHHKLLNIKKVAVKVVAGKKTNIDFEAAPTNCQLHTGEQDSASDCKVDGDVIDCHAVIWERLWLNKKEINVNCNIKNKVNRTKRALVKYEIQNPKEKKYQFLAEESLHKFQTSKGLKNKYEVLSVTKVMTQVLSKIVYNIEFLASKVSCTLKKSCGEVEKVLFCQAKIWDRPWLSSRKIHVNCEEEYDNKENFVGEKRHISFPSGPEGKDINSDEIKTLALETLQIYEEKIKSKYIYKIVEIYHASEEIDNVIITKLSYSIAPTNCTIENLISINDCKIQTIQPTLRCAAEILLDPWLDSQKNISIDCLDHEHSLSEILNVNQHSRLKRQVEEDYVDDDTKFYYADRAVQHINENSHTNNLQKLITIHAFQSGTVMDVHIIRMYIETAYTYCLRHQDEADLADCEELSGMFHKICLVKLWPSPDDELIVQGINIVCNDEKNFPTASGISLKDLIVASITELESSTKVKNKIVTQGEPHFIPRLDPKVPIKLNFIIAFTNCSKDVEFDIFSLQMLNDLHVPCVVDRARSSKRCSSYIWMTIKTNKIKRIKVFCTPPNVMRKKRSISLDVSNATSDEITIHNLVKESIEKLEMMSQHKYKQRLLQINNYSTKITSGLVTTINFDVGYTSCLKFEWIDNITNCEFFEHLPRRHCISTIWQRLWLDNGKDIEVTCEDDEAPIEAHVEFENPEQAMLMAKEALKHIEAKYPYPRRQKVVRIFSLEKQTIAGVHYRMKIEIGNTNCLALSLNDSCDLARNMGENRFCRVNVWIRPWTDHPPNYRVSCDYEEGVNTEMHRHLQAEQLFYDFITTYRPDYINDHVEMGKRFEIFKNNVKKIHELNIYERGTARYAVTKFTDLSYEEFSNRYLGLKPGLRDPNQIPFRMADIPDIKILDNFDWRTYGAVTEVKNQESCGSCWAFSVTGNVEGQWKIWSGELVSLSEQELVDCDKIDEGCNGGLPDNAYRAIEQLGGLEAENDYPYEGVNDKCVYNKTLSKVHIRGALNISSNETDMAKWLTQNGPISIGINANAMQFYVGGVSHPWRMLCNPNNLDHGVLIVGYGVKDYPLFHKHLPYWLVKNSWGTSWGEQGYYRVFRGDGTCGVNLMASSSIV